MNEVARQQKVLVTRVGSFWIDLERADKIDQIRENDPTAVIEIDGNKVQAASIYATLTPAQYQNYQNEKRGLWQCMYKNWHPRNDTCACARNIPQRPSESKIETITDEQREKNREKLAQIRKNFMTRKKGTQDVGGQQSVSEQVRVRPGTNDGKEVEIPDAPSEGGVRRDVDSEPEQGPGGVG